MNPPNVLVECSIENIRDELCVPRMRNEVDISFVPPKYMYIKTLIPVVLDLYNVQYAHWSTVFRDAARANNLLHHIDPTVPAPPLPDVSIISSFDDDDTTLWRRQDAIVLSWIYATVSPYLLAKLFSKTSSTKAMDTWAMIHEICQEYTITVNKKKRKFIHIDEDFHVVDDGVDLISNLSDDLLVYVLFLVADMKTAARSCILSKRWTHLWTYLEDLDFDDPETYNTLNFACYAQPGMDKFVDRVNRVITANQATRLDTFRIQFLLTNFYAAHIHNWLKFAFGKEVRKLDLDFGAVTYPSIHYLNIFSNNPALILNTTLTSFHLRSVTIKGPFLQWVLTNCLNLQHLSIHHCRASADADEASSPNHRKLVVSSHQLKHLEFFNSLKLLKIEVLCLSAPNLTSFVIDESKFDVEYQSVPSLADATFGGIYCYHIFKHLDTLSGFSSQLEKLSIHWYLIGWHMDMVAFQMVSYEYNQFPSFANVQHLEIVSTYNHSNLIRSTSLIEACPLLHTFKLKMMCYTEQIFKTHCYTELDATRQISAPNYAQENAIRCHQHLKVVEYLGYHGCASAADLAICLARHAPKLQRFIFDTREPQLIESLRPTSDKRDRVKILRRTEFLAKRIQRREYPLDVVIL